MRAGNNCHIGYTKIFIVVIISFSTAILIDFKVKTEKRQRKTTLQTSGRALGSINRYVNEGFVFIPRSLE